jgi:hypothetical protein
VSGVAVASGGRRARANRREGMIFRYVFMDWFDSGYWFDSSYVKEKAG